MLGAIGGDVVGSAFEWSAVKKTDFDFLTARSRFTDDTVLTVAAAEALLTDGDFASAFVRWYRKHPDSGFGGMFRRWAEAGGGAPYGSFGNGSAMRVAPCGEAAATLDEALELARASAAVTHDHPEGLAGAQATAVAIFLARAGESREAIRAFLRERFGYPLDRSLAEIRPGYRFDVTCQGSVPEALTAFFEADSWESAIRNAVSLGGDADTQAAIAGGPAEGFFGPVGEPRRAALLARLTDEMREIVARFEARYPHPHSRAASPE